MHIPVLPVITVTVVIVIAETGRICSVFRLVNIGSIIVRSK